MKLTSVHGTLRTRLVTRYNRKSWKLLATANEAAPENNQAYVKHTRYANIFSSYHEDKSACVGHTMTCFNQYFFSQEIGHSFSLKIILRDFSRDYFFLITNSTHFFRSLPLTFNNFKFFHSNLDIKNLKF